MRTTIGVLLVALLVAGCADGTFRSRTIVDGPCGDVDGYTYTLVTYGSGTISVIPISRIRANTEWRFYLFPVDKLGGAAAYGDKDVTIDGKASGSPVLTSGAATLSGYTIPTPPATDDWLFVEGDFNSDASGSGSKRYLVVCVDPDVEIDQEWHYSVTIDDVGEVDPRGRVER